MYDVYFYETFSEEKELLISEVGCRIKAACTPLTIAESGHRTPPAKIISIRTQSAVPPEWSSSIHAVLTRSVGYDHLAHFRKGNDDNIALGYLPDYCAGAVAEQAILLMLALMRRLHRQTAQGRRFNRNGLTGDECAGKTLLVVGVGRIGKRVLDLVRGLGMQTLGVDIDPRHPSVEYVSIPDGMKAADVIVCAMNLTRHNAAYFNQERFRELAKPAYFINVGRGECSPPRDLLAALEERRLNGVALDVFPDEGRLAENWRKRTAAPSPEAAALLRLARRKDVILTPHNAFNTRESVKRKAEQSVAQIMHYVQYGRFIWEIPADDPA